MGCDFAAIQDRLKEMQTLHRPPTNQSKRSMNGNLILLSAFLVGLIGFGLLIGLGFYLILSHQQRGQSLCDEMSMTISKNLNNGDRIGQLNAVIEHSRELVYLSRENVNTAYDLALTPYQALAAQLMDEAREGAGIVEKERQNQIKVALTECSNLISKEKERAAGSPGVFITPWLFETRPQITRVKLGWIKDTLASVESPSVLAELQKHDLKQHYLEQSSKLFHGNIDAKLPAPDDDLPFHFASLPAHVEKIDAPPRLVNSDVFVSLATIFDKAEPTHVQKPTEVPSAVQVTGLIGIKTGEHTQLELKTVSSAAASSALQAP